VQFSGCVSLMRHNAVISKKFKFFFVEFFMKISNEEVDYMVSVINDAMPECNVVVARRYGYYAIDLYCSDEKMMRTIISGLSRKEMTAALTLCTELFTWLLK